MITQARMEATMEAVFKECQALRAAGQKEYAHDVGNALRNFDACATEMNISREQVLWVFMKKHFDGIAAYITGHRSQRESVKGRINDAIVYLCILRAMIEDREEMNLYDHSGPSDAFKMESAGRAGPEGWKQ